MKKILISLNDDTLNFKYKIDKTKEEKNLSKTLLNTNVISNDELLFSDAYLKNNAKIMTSFLNEIVKEKKLTKIVIEEFEIVPIVLDITNQIKNLTSLYITGDFPINYSIYEKLQKSSYLRYVNCFEIPSFMLEVLCNNGIVVDLRCEILSISNFVYQNNLVNYTKLYYRKTVKIFDKFNKEDLDDFETFCQINRNLKTIYVYCFDIEMIENIYSILEKTHKKYIRVLIHQNMDNTKQINESIKRLKLVNKKLIKNLDSKIKIIYSVDYIRKNFIKQLSITNLKTCLLIIVLLEVVVFASIKINNLKTKKNIDEITEIQDDLSYLFESEPEESEDNPEVIESNEEPVITPYNTLYEQAFDKLLEINNDTKAWLSLNNTSVNFPVVQSSDNSFYLNHDFNKDVNSNGWIFVDYRNNMNELDQNTIIYGHNIKGDLMFSSLRNTIKESWYTNPENTTFTFNTINNAYKAKIFSIYIVDNTNDYLYINFSDEDFVSFINMIKDRSIYNFNEDITLDDKIVTLSTCSNIGDKRLVIHAKIL